MSGLYTYMVCTSVAPEIPIKGFYDLQIAQEWIDENNIVNCKVKRINNDRSISM